MAAVPDQLSRIGRVNRLAVFLSVCLFIAGGCREDSQPVAPKIETHVPSAAVATKAEKEAHYLIPQAQVPLAVVVPCLDDEDD